MKQDDKYQLILNWFDNASTEIKILPVDVLAVEKLSEYLEFNVRSFFGSIITNTGGIVVDNWLRIYGSGEIDFVARNKELSGYGTMIVAEDISGGLFSITSEGTLSYFAPDSLEWEDMDITYSDFLKWVTEREYLNQFYETFRFKDWETVIKDIKTNQGIGYFPFLWAESENKERHIEVISITEIQKLQFEFSKAL